MNTHGRFGHPPARLSFWRRLVRPLLGRQPTPFYLCSVRPIQEGLAQLERAFGRLPVRHWLSCKTQPLRPLLRWWRQAGRPIEAVSEYEFRAAQTEGFAPGQILVNGPAKQHWLPRHPVPGLSVNFDSVLEAAALGPLAAKLGWSTGLRLSTGQEFDPEAPAWPTQFGMTIQEAASALRSLKRHRVVPRIAHFHLRTNVSSAAVYQRAVQEVAEICHTLRWAPQYLDCGGGFPPPRVRDREGRFVDAAFDLGAMARIYERAFGLFPGLREIWLENGRWLSAGSGVLVVKVLDRKERRGMRHLICDGGRTTQALVSTWEHHALLSHPARRGPKVPTTVTGPTCMAFDQLARRPMPRSIRPGDHLLWLEAGAYHLPWETRFSHGLAAVLWHDGHRVSTVRSPESFEQWWGQWR